MEAADVNTKAKTAASIFAVTRMTDLKDVHVNPCGVKAPLAKTVQPKWGDYKTKSFDLVMENMEAGNNNWCLDDSTTGKSYLF